MEIFILKNLINPLTDDYFLFVLKKIILHQIN